MGAICGENTLTNAETASGQPHGASPRHTGPAPDAQASPFRTRDSLPPPENGHRGSLPNTTAYGLRAGVPAVPYRYSEGQV
jgi:hypothetical protein